MAFPTFGPYPIAAGSLLLYGAAVGYRTYSGRVYEREGYSVEFFLFTTLLLVTALADVLGWI